MFYSVRTGHTILFIGCTILSTCIQSRPVLIKRFLSEHTDRIMTGSDERQTHIAAINRTIAGKILPRMPERATGPTVIPGLILYRRDWNYLSENCFYPPAITAVIQGQRNSFLGEREYHYEEGECLVHSVDVPSVNYYTKATPEKPFLSVSLQVDRYLAARFAREIPPFQPRKPNRKPRKTFPSPESTSWCWMLSRLSPCSTTPTLPFLSAVLTRNPLPR